MPFAAPAGRPRQEKNDEVFGPGRRLLIGPAAANTRGGWSRLNRYLQSDGNSCLLTGVIDVARVIQLNRY